MSDTDYSDSEILDFVISGWWTWGRAAKALRAKGWDTVDLMHGHDECARLWKERETANLIREYESHVLTEIRGNRWPGDSEMPRFRGKPQSFQVLGISMKGKRHG